MPSSRAKIKAGAAPSRPGILPSQAIRELLSAGVVRTAEPLLDGQLQPASLDLRLGSSGWRVRASFLPAPATTVRDKLSELALHEIPFGPGAVLETGCVYVAPLLESLALPAHISAAANPKSSTGRLDVFTRIIADGVGGFDHIPAGYAGPLYAEICPQTFPVIVRRGSRLSQIRFRMDTSAPGGGRGRNRPGAPQADVPREIALSVDLAGGKSGRVGYRAKRHTGLIDVDQSASYAIADYWEPIAADSSRRLILDPDQFYILASKEAVTVPPTHAAEMLPFDPLVGEFRVHYAGFFDPGFGHETAGGTGARAVLEVRSHKVPFILEDGQVVGRLIYEPLTALPEMLYGREMKSHYQAQGLKLSKHFK